MKMFEDWSGGLTDFGPTSLIIVGGIALVFTLLFYGIGKYIAPKLGSSEVKRQNYTCGEDASTMTGPLQVRRLFTFALYFLIFDAAVFILSLTLTTSDYAPTIFIGILAITATLVIARWRHSFGNS